MKTLRLERLNYSQGLTFGPVERLSSRDEVFIWKVVLQKFLHFTFPGRDACLITVAPQVWSLGRELSDAPETIINGENYLLTFCTACSIELLTKVAESEDFERNLLWLTPLFVEEKEHIYELIRAEKQNSLGVVHTHEELLSCVADGELLQWLNPNRSINEIIHATQSMAEFIGWSFDSSLEDE